MEILLILLKLLEEYKSNINNKMVIAFLYTRANKEALNGFETFLFF